MKLEQKWTIALLYVSESLKYWDIYPYLFTGLADLAWNSHAFTQSKMATFQTYNKELDIKTIVLWLEILQLPRCTIAVITWHYLNLRMDSYTSLNTSFKYLNMMVWPENTDYTLSLVKNQFYCSCTRIIFWTWFFLLCMCWYVKIMKNHVFYYNFSCVNVSEIRICPLITTFYWIYNVPLFVLKIGVSKEQIAILSFAHNWLLLT